MSDQQEERGIKSPPVDDKVQLLERDNMESPVQGGQLNPVFEFEENVEEELGMKTGPEETPPRKTSHHTQPESTSTLNIPDAGKEPYWILCCICSFQT